MGLDDTHPKIREIQLEIVRNMTPQQRLFQAVELSNFVMTVARQAIQRANPEATESELELLYVLHFYGPDVAAMVERARIQAHAALPNENVE